MSEKEKKEESKNKTWESNPNIIMPITKSDSWKPNEKIVHYHINSKERKSESDEWK